jgi:hypothetical protein
MSLTPDVRTTRMASAHSTMLCRYYRSAARKLTLTTTALRITPPRLGLTTTAEPLDPSPQGAEVDRLILNVDKALIACVV